MEKKTYTINETLKLERGGMLSQVEIAYETWGSLNEKRDNVIWVFHALTANADVADWWPGMVGDGKLMDPGKDFIICANILGSCYGTTGPLSKDPGKNSSYFHDYPQLTIRDMVALHIRLFDELDLQRIKMAIGGSIGSFQALEWAVTRPDDIKHLVFMASGAKASPWAIAFNESQRMAIEADQTFQLKQADAGAEGLKAARSIALLSYRNAATYNATQQEEDTNKLDNFRSCSYQRYQGEKLHKRFNAFSYHRLLSAFDTHNVGRNRGGIQEALAKITAKTLILAIDSDILFPPEEMKELAPLIKNSHWVMISSRYGHDGFLIEVEKITKHVKKFLKNGKH